MASSSNSPTPDEEEKRRWIELFESIQLDTVKAEQTVRNAELAARLEQLILEAGVDPSTGCSRTKGAMIYEIATAFPQKLSQPEVFRAYIVKAIKTGRLQRNIQLKSAFAFVKDIPAGAPIDDHKFDRACGVGLEISQSQIDEKIAALVAENEAKIAEQGPKFNRNACFGALTKDPILKFADPTELKATLFRVLDQKIGVVTPSDAAAPASSSSSSSSSPSSSSGARPSGPSEDQIAEADKIVLVQPSEEFTTILLSSIENKDPAAVLASSGRILVQGWCDKVRDANKGRIKFVEFRDGSSVGFLQCVLEGDKALCRAGLFLRRESSVRLWGRLVPAAKTPRQCFPGLELAVDYWQLVGDAPADLEGLVNDDTQPKELMDNRHIVLRRGRPAKYMRMRSHILLAMRQHFDSRGFLEVIPPTLVETQCEGGSTLFELGFYGQKAYLTQSSQLYLETVLPSLGKVFCIAQSYRAEKSKTRRHLCEYTHLEAELPFISFPQLLDAIEDLICDTLERVLSGPHGDLLRSLNPKLKVPSRPFRRMDYAEAVEYCNSHGIKKLDEEGREIGEFEFGDDIPELPERTMIDQIGEPVFLCRFPVHLKSFYMPKDPTDLRVTLSTDLLMPGVGEVVGGSMRIDSYEELMAGYAREGLSSAPYYWYTDQRKFGTCPHGGYGLGVERFLTWLFDEYHIRNVCTYPRYTGRCAP